MSKRLIKIYVDESCEMAQLDLDGECVMSGNFWDFHPGCHGIRQYGDFEGYIGLAKAIQHMEGGLFKIEIDRNWKYL